MWGFFLHSKLLWHWSWGSHFLLNLHQLHRKCCICFSSLWNIWEFTRFTIHEIQSGECKTCNKLIKDSKDKVYFKPRAENSFRLSSAITRFSAINGRWDGYWCFSSPSSVISRIWTVLNTSEPKVLLSFTYDCTMTSFCTKKTETVSLDTQHRNSAALIAQ